MKTKLLNLIKKLILAFITFLVLLVLVVFSLSAYVDRQIVNLKYEQSYNDCHKVWTARGLYGEGIDQNSIESIGEAFAEGAMGVEVDIFYDVELKDYIVSHDFPYNKKNGELLPLKNLFDALGEGHYFWLDFKRMRRLNKQEALAAVQRLIDISPNHNLKDRIYVEGENPTNLALFRKAGFHTIMDTHPEPANSFLAPVMIAAYKVLFYFGDHTVLGMEYGSLENPVYGPKTRERLGPIPVFLYHLPVDEPLIDELMGMDAVRAFLVGNNQSVDFFGKNNCNEQESAETE